MRDVAVVSYAASAVAKEVHHNEVEIITPVIRDAVVNSGIPAKEIGFTCSGSLDYLFGGPFAFVQGIDAVGAWPPIRESHVEMDAAWALYEAWIAIQTGEVDSALIYGFSKGSLGDVVEIMAMQHDPYYLVPLWPSMFDLAAMQARAYLEENDLTDAVLADVAARAQRSGLTNPHAVRKGDVTAEDLLATPVRYDPLRESDVFPTSDGATAVVIAAADVARNVCERPAWIRGIEHRIEAHSIGVRDIVHSGSTRAAAAAAGRAGPIDVAELHAQFSHEVLILCDALDLDDLDVVNPSGGPLAANTIMAAGLSRIGEVAKRIHEGKANRGIAHATSGPCLQQNLVCILEGE